MTIILRTLALISAFLGIVLFVMPIMMLVHGASRIGNVIASTVLVLIAILAMRCTKWLWQKRRFWTEIRALSEVSAFGCLILLWPIDVFLEQKTDGAAIEAVQIATVLVAVAVYLFIRRYGRIRTIHPPISEC